MSEVITAIIVALIATAIVFLIAAMLGIVDAPWSTAAPTPAPAPAPATAPAPVPAPTPTTCMGINAQYTFLGNKLAPGTKISTCQGLKSPTGSHILVQQSDGNLVLYNIKTGKPIYAHSMQGKIPITKVNANLPNNTLYQADYNFVTYNAGGNPIWSANLAGKQSNELTMQDDGNLVIYNSGKPLWSTQTSKL